MGTSKFSAMEISQEKFRLKIDNVLFFLVTGNFDSSQTSAGSISCLNIWSGMHSSEDSMTFSNCEHYGDIFHLNTISGAIHGSVMPRVTTKFGEWRGKIKDDYTMMTLKQTSILL